MHIRMKITEAEILDQWINRHDNLYICPKCGKPNDFFIEVEFKDYIKDVQEQNTIPVESTMPCMKCRIEMVIEMVRYETITAATGFTKFTWRGIDE
jgi:hypothetical protein